MGILTWFSPGLLFHCLLNDNSNILAPRDSTGSNNSSLYVLFSIIFCFILKLITALYLIHNVLLWQIIFGRTKDGSAKWLLEWEGSACQEDNVLLSFKLCLKGVSPDMLCFATNDSISLQVKFLKKVLICCELWGIKELTIHFGTN